MKATELRIGNWVQYNAFAGVVCSSDLFDIDKGIIKAQPIPLTKEWLERFGFETSIFNWRLGEFRVSIKDGVYSVMFRGIIISRDLKHVHQLQNIYHALTGEELNQKQIR